MAQVPMRTTSLTPAQMAAPGGPFVLGHQVVAGKAPSAVFLRSALGIIGLENANGRAIQNHNWGNVMAGPWWRSKFSYWAHPKPSPGQPAYFREYSNHVAGAAEFWRLLYKRPGVLDAALTGDIRGMVAELYRTAYVVASSPGEEARYAEGVGALVDEYQRAGLFADAPTRGPGGWLALLLVGAGIAGAFVERKKKT